MLGMRPNRKITANLLTPEVVFTASRSGGPGGQNVNKVNSKVSLQFHVDNSAILTAEEKALLKEKLSSKINREGFLTVAAQESRSQGDNKATAIAKLDMLLTKAQERKKARKATKPGKSAVQERIKKKKVISEKKKWRRKPDL